MDRAHSARPDSCPRSADFPTAFHYTGSSSAEMILSPSAAGMKSSTRLFLWAGAAVIMLIAAGATFWTRQFHSYTPIEALHDLEAAAKVRNAPQPVERFMELRYGPLTDPANRQKAFLDFFNVGHIKGLNILVSRMPSDRRQSNI